jgi:hypothetical protein
VVVPGEERSVAIRGHATLLDRLPASTRELARAPFALPVFAGRNAIEMAAFARDAALSRTAPAPPAPVSVRVEQLELLEGWAADAVLGWAAPDGPIALPARWDPERRRARVPAAALKAAGGPRTAAACVCVDESEGPGPLAKKGSLVRGTGHATMRGETATVAIDAERVTRWTGFDTTTAPAGLT